MRKAWGAMDLEFSFYVWRSTTSGSVKAPPTRTAPAQNEAQIVLNPYLASFGSRVGSGNRLRERFK